MVEKVLTEKGLSPLSDLSRSLGTESQTISAAAIPASPDWQGRLIKFTQACTVTIPSTLPADFSCGWSQEGAGVITFVAGAGETLESFGGLLASAGQFAIGGIAGMGASKHRLYGQLA